MKAKDPTRPILLNLGQGVANDEWVGRGPEGKPEDYLTYVKGSDMVSFDIYPVTGLDKPDSENYLWYVPKGVDRLVKWTEGKKPVWTCIECTRIGERDKKATPRQVRAEVWMSLTHGSRGLIYFVHQFAPKFNEHALLDDPEMLSGVMQINRQIHELAPVLNSPLPVGGAGSVSSSNKVPISMMIRRYQGSTYVFSVGMRNEAVRGTFGIVGMPPKTEAEVLGESRKIPVNHGIFSDDFKPYDVHLYRIRASAR
jgi:hypothetical protein